MNGSSNRIAPPRLPRLSSGRLASIQARSSPRNCASSAVSLRSTGVSLPRSDPMGYSSGSSRSSSRSSSSSSSRSSSSSSSSVASSSKSVMPRESTLRRRQSGVARCELHDLAPPLERQQRDGADDDRDAD